MIILVVDMDMLWKITLQPFFRLSDFAEREKEIVPWRQFNRSRFRETRAACRIRQREQTKHRPKQIFMCEMGL